MTTVSPTYRLSTALVALLFALGTGVPTAQAACMSTGTTEAGHCGGSETAQHCDGEMGEASAVCLTHHASQEAYTQHEPSVEPDYMGGSGEPTPPSNRIRKTTAFHPSSSRRASQRGDLLHARIGVWLE